MAYSKIEMSVFNGATSIAEENGCYVYDVEYVKEGGEKYLRVFVDKEECGISIDECEVISRSLSSVLDSTNLIKENYILEVSSPGIERKLKTAEHFKKYMGKTIDIGLYKAFNGSKIISGELLGYLDNGDVEVLVNEEKICLHQNEMAYVKLHFDF